MRAIKRILVVADPAQKQPALERALSLAKALDAEVELVGFVHDPAAEAGAQLGTRDRARLRTTLIDRRLDELSRVVTRAGADAPVRVVWTRRMAAWLCANAARLGADLVVKSCHPSGRVLHLPSDWYLMRNLPLPLWIVSPLPLPARRRVLAAFNAGDDGRAQRALDRTVADAAAWAGALLDAELHAAYVRDLPTFLLDLDVVEKRKYVAGQERLAARALAKRLRTFRGKRFVPHASAGRPEHQLPRLARELRPRLVVFGTSARRGVERFLFGSTSEQVMAQVRTDTLVVKRGGR